MTLGSSLAEVFDVCFLSKHQINTEDRGARSGLISMRNQLNTRRASRWDCADRNTVRFEIILLQYIAKMVVVLTFTKVNKPKKRKNITPNIATCSRSSEG